ncbi:MAG: hypothetical protein HY553_01270 [Elusimicrobia bacterium]|nr:hypothetical protein [Elusimicrobiota bacterium]
MRALLALALLAVTRPAEARPSLYGFNFPAWQADQYAHAKTAESLERLARTGARWVSITPTWYAESARDSRIRRGPKTPTDESVRAVIRKARSLGLSVALKPHVDLPGDAPRALLLPSDFSAWFAEYRAFVTHYARIAAEEDCGLFVVGTELFMTSGFLFQAQWLRVIADVKRAYPGRLTYAANWYDAPRVPFWGALDFIGIDGYYPVPGKNRAEMRRNWGRYRVALSALARIHGKPVLFTELGLASQRGANLRPWNWHDFGELDLQVQADYFAAFLDVFQDRDWFAGLLQWAWEVEPEAGGLRDKSMTVQGKPALDVLAAAFRRANPPPLGAALKAASQRALRVPLPLP